jgi:hypothetical protein
MLTISLKEFCLTGRFGPVHLGMNIEDAVKLLGSPDQQGDFNKQFGGITYAWYEIHYSVADKSIVGIQNDHLALSLGKKGQPLAAQHRNAIHFQSDMMQIDKWFLQPGKDFTYAEVIDLLRSDQISFTTSFNEWQGHLIHFPSGVKMDFDLSDKRRTESDTLRHQPNEDDIEVVLTGIRLFG